MNKKDIAAFESFLARAERRSNLEATFLQLWNLLGGPALVEEHRFAPPRKWRFDFAHPASMTAIEIEGGIWRGGRHTRGKGYESDCMKYHVATLAGWAVFRLTDGMIHADFVEPIIERCVTLGVDEEAA